MTRLGILGKENNYSKAYITSDVWVIKFASTIINSSEIRRKHLLHDTEKKTEGKERLKETKKKKYREGQNNPIKMCKQGSNILRKSLAADQIRSVVAKQSFFCQPDQRADSQTGLIKI